MESTAMTYTTHTIVPTRYPDRMLDAYASHLRDDHDVALLTLDDNARCIEQDGFRIELRVAASGLAVRLEAASVGTLAFMKAGIAEHVATADLGAANAMRWSGETARSGQLPPNFRLLEVCDSRQLFSGMQRVRLHLPDLPDVVDEGPHLKLMLPAVDGRRSRWPQMGENGAPIWPTGVDALHARFMTIADIDVAEQTVALDIVQHELGLFSRWSRRTRVGDHIGAMGPVGAVRLPVLHRYLFAADLSALSTLAHLLAALPPNAVGDAIIATPPGCDPQRYLPCTNLTLHRLSPGCFGTELLRLLARLQRPDYAWFAGEHSDARTVRRFFTNELDLDKSSRVTAAYWRRCIPDTEG